MSSILFCKCRCSWLNYVKVNIKGLWEYGGMILDSKLVLGEWYLFFFI